MFALELLIVVGLILLNGFLSMSELALVSARRGRLEQMVRDGSRGAQAALDLAGNSGRLLSAIQIGITLVGIIAGAFSGATIAERGDAWLEEQGVPTRVAEPLAFAVVIAVITYFSVVLGELVPKQIGLRNAERIAAIVARPMQIFAFVASPVVGLLDWSARLGLRLLGPSAQQETQVTDEDIKSLIAAAEREGLVDPEERSMISRVMRLGDRSVRGLMTPRPDLEWLDLAGTNEEIRQTVRLARHGRLLASEGSIDEVVGVLPVRQALVAMTDRGASAVCALVQKVPAVSDRISAIDAMRELRRAPLKLLLVVNEHGSVEGIVTEGDILKAVVANIEVTDAPHIVTREDGSLLIDGAFPIDELAERLRLSLPPNRPYHTVAGFALNEMRRLPRAGEAFHHGQWQFEIVDLDGRRIDKLLATPLTGLHRGV